VRKGVAPTRGPWGKEKWGTERRHGEDELLLERGKKCLQESEGEGGKGELTRAGKALLTIVEKEKERKKLIKGEGKRKVEGPEEEDRLDSD